HGRAGGGKAQVAVRPPLGSEVPLDVGTIVGVDATKKNSRVVAARGAGREFLQINAVVNGGRVVEIRVAVGRAGGHQVADVVVYTEDRQDALGGEAVDGCEQRCGRQPRISERQKIE